MLTTPLAKREDLLNWQSSSPGERGALLRRLLSWLGRMAASRDVLPTVELLLQLVGKLMMLRKDEWQSTLMHRLPELL